MRKTQKIPRRLSTVALAAALYGCASSAMAPNAASGSGAASELTELLSVRTRAPSGWPSYPGRGFAFKAPPDLRPDGLGMFDPNSPMTLGGLQGSLRLLWEIGPANATRHPDADSPARPGVASVLIAGRRVWVEDESFLSGEVTAYFQPDQSGYALTFVVAAPGTPGTEVREIAAEIIRSIRFR